MRGADEPGASANHRNISKRRMIGGEEKMIPVVDHRIEDLIVIRSAASSGVTGSLVQDDFCSAARKPHGGSETGKTGADDMNFLQHQIKAHRMIIHNSRARGSWIGARGGDQPRSTRRVRIAR